MGPDSKFVLKDVLWPSQSLQVLMSNPELYVKKIRDGGDTVEIALGNDAASIEGTVTDAGVPGPATIFLSRWPLPEPIVLEKWIATRDDGTFKLTGLAPGEYRLFALGGKNIPPQNELKRLFADSIRVTLEAHEQKTLDVKR